MPRRKIQLALALGIVVAALLALALSPRARFVVGGAFVNAGFRLQDRIHAFDLTHDEAESPEDVWQELLAQNRLASGMRALFPRSTEHPLVALLVCMDARIDTSELVGDTRRYYYIVRTAGSALAAPEQEMLELAVLNGVKVIVLTTHSDCAAEGVAASAEKRARFPELVSLVDQRASRIEEFKARPVIRDALAKGSLVIKYAHIDTGNDKLVVETHP